MSTIGPKVFRNVLGHFPTGVTVVTGMDGDEPAGLTIGSFTSVSLDPPMVGFLPGKGSSTWEAIQKSGSFCVNVLGNHQADEDASWPNHTNLTKVPLGISSVSRYMKCEADRWISRELWKLKSIGSETTEWYEKVTGFGKKNPKNLEP